MTKQKYIYAIMLVIANKDGSFSTEPVGVYTSLEDAQKYIKELEEATFANKINTNCVFDIIELELNQKPLLIDGLKKLKNEILERIDNNLVELVKKGYIDQLVGEDGFFYYQITESGKKFLEKNQT